VNLAEEMTILVVRRLTTQKSSSKSRLICRESGRERRHRQRRRLRVIASSQAQFRPERTTSAATLQPSFSNQTTAAANLQGLLERMMGLEPTTFCMAIGSWVRSV
jgi:hypothetical protein